MKAKELLKPGDLFEKYQVESLLGHGGMGAVYKVRHTLLDTSFAIKVLFPEVADQNKKFIDRFLREARLAGKIRHENLIAVYDAGQNRKTRLYYLVMEYISGGTLRARLRKEHRLTSADAIKIITGIAQALEKAFEYNIVHRDIKPDNIMFAENGTVKLADLGIAKAVDPQDTTLTLEQSVFGTPAYMSPEQARDSHMVDCRADIYSLGIVFYEMLAGRRPYSGSSTIELLSQIIDNKEVPDIRAVNSSVGDPLAELIRSMMAKDPAERPQTPAELLQRLRSPEIQSQKQFPIAASLPGEADSPEETVRCGTRPMFVNKIPLVKDLDPADNRKTTNPPTHPEPSGKETSLDPDAEIPAGSSSPVCESDSVSASPSEEHPGKRKRGHLLPIAGILFLALIALLLLFRGQKSPSYSEKTTIPPPQEKVSPVPALPPQDQPSTPKEESGKSILLPNSAVILGGRTPTNLTLLNRLQKDHNRPPAALLKTETPREIRKQLKDAIRNKASVVFLALSAPSATGDISQANFETLIREVAVQLQDSRIPFAFILESPDSVPESGRGKLETFNQAVRELSKLRSLNCFDFTSGPPTPQQADSCIAALRSL